jgi:hypothetical protein
LTLATAFGTNIPPEVRSSMSLAAGVLKGTAISTKPDAVVGRQVIDAGEPVADYLLAEHWWTKVSALYKIRRPQVT